MEDTAMDDPTAEAIATIEIDASPIDVWQAITTDDGLADWLGQGSSIGQAPGDGLIAHDVVTGETRRGVLDEVSPEHRLGYTWWPETDARQATHVTITLTPCTAGTKVTVIETRPAAAPVATLSASASAAAWTWRAALLLVACTSPARLFHQV